MWAERPVDAVRARIAELIGFRPAVGVVTTQALERETCDGYVRTRLRFDGASKPVEAFLFESVVTAVAR